MNARMHEWINAQLKGRINIGKCEKGCKDEWMKGWKEGLMNE